MLGLFVVKEMIDFLVVNKLGPSRCLEKPYQNFV